MWCAYETIIIQMTFSVHLFGQNQYWWCMMKRVASNDDEPIPTYLILLTRRGCLIIKDATKADSGRSLHLYVHFYAEIARSWLLYLLHTKSASWILDHISCSREDCTFKPGWIMTDTPHLWKDPGAQGDDKQKQLIEWQVSENQHTASGQRLIERPIAHHSLALEA